MPSPYNTGQYHVFNDGGTETRFVSTVKTVKEAADHICATYGSKGLAYMGIVEVRIRVIQPPPATQSSPEVYA